MNNPNDVEVCIDYLTMTSKIHSPVHCMELLGLLNVEFMPIKSFLGYQNCDFYEGVRIHWTHTDLLYEVCIDLSGRGCRTVEHLSNLTFDWLAFFRNFEADMKTGDVHISRLDIAGDDFVGILNYDTLTAYSQARKFVCRAKVEPWGTWGRKKSIYFGSEQSDRMVRIYDKALEQKNDQIPHWLRCEMQMRNACALSFILNWFENPFVGNLYAGVLLDYLRFTTKPNMIGEHHECRLKTAGFWQRFIGEIERIPQLYLQGREYTLERCYKFVKKSAASSLKTMMMASGGDVSGIVDIIVPAKLNRKQELLLNQLDVDKTAMSDALMQLATRNFDQLSLEQQQFIIDHKKDSEKCQA